PAPVLLSTMNCRPNTRDRCSATRRAITSVEPPATTGTMKRTGRLGHDWAHAICDVVAKAAAPVAKCRNRRRENFMGVPSSEMLTTMRLPLSFDGAYSRHSSRCACQGDQCCQLLSTRNSARFRCIAPLAQARPPTCPQGYGVCELRATVGHN